MYQRKTHDEWQLLIDYGQGFEVVTTSTTLKEARQVHRDYLNNDDNAIQIRTRKVRVRNED